MTVPGPSRHRADVPRLTPQVPLQSPGAFPGPQLLGPSIAALLTGPPMRRGAGSLDQPRPIAPISRLTPPEGGSISCMGGTLGVTATGAMRVTVVKLRHDFDDCDAPAAGPVSQDHRNRHTWYRRTRNSPFFRCNSQVATLKPDSTPGRSFRAVLICRPCWLCRKSGPSVRPKDHSGWGSTRRYR